MSLWERADTCYNKEAEKKNLRNQAAPPGMSWESLGFAWLCAEAKGGTGWPKRCQTEQVQPCQEW